MTRQALIDACLLRPYTGKRTQILVAAAFVLNLACYFEIDAPTDPLKLAVQQCLILTVGTIGAKLDRLKGA